MSPSQSCEDVHFSDVLVTELSYYLLSPDASKDIPNQPVVQEEGDDEGEWIVQQTSRSRMQQVKDLDDLSQNRSKSQSPTPQSRSSVKP